MSIPIWKNVLQEGDGIQSKFFKIIVDSIGFYQIFVRAISLLRLINQ